MSDDLKRHKLVRGEPGYRDQMCVRPDGAWTLYEPAAARIEELTRERDEAIRAGQFGSGYQTFVKLRADRDRLAALLKEAGEVVREGVYLTHKGEARRDALLARLDREERGEG